MVEIKWEMDSFVVLFAIRPIARALYPARDYAHWPRIADSIPVAASVGWVYRLDSPGIPGILLAEISGGSSYER